MALRTETVDLEAERERLHDEMEETAEEQIEWANGERDGSIEYVQQLQSRGTTLKDYREILSWAQSEWGISEVTFAGLAAGEVNRAEDFVDDHEGVRHRDAFVAIGTHDAPFVKHDPDNVRPDEYEETVLTIVSEVPLPFVRWAEEKIGELSHLGSEMGNEYTKLLLDAATAKTEADASG